MVFRQTHLSKTVGQSEPPEKLKLNKKVGHFSILQEEMEVFSKPFIFV